MIIMSVPQIPAHADNMANLKKEKQICSDAVPSLCVGMRLVAPGKIVTASPKMYLWVWVNAEL